MKRFMEFLHENRYLSLLISLLVLILIPFFIDYAPIRGLIATLCISIVVLVSLGIVVSSKKVFKVGLIIVLVVVGSEWLLLIFTNSLLSDLISNLIIIIFFIWIMIRLIKYIYASAQVEADVIYVAISIYLIFGFMGALIASTIDLVFANAYSSVLAMSGGYGDFLYYSFVTMTTLGYGDIVPKCSEAEALAIVLTMIGQFYMAIVIATLISKFVTRSDK